MAFWSMGGVCDGIRTGQLYVCGGLGLVIRKAEDAGV